MTKLAKVESTHIERPSLEGLERVLIDGDLGGLSQPQRIAYYERVCESVGLNPLTQPFEYLKLQGKTILYAKRACTDQLRKIHRVSVSIVSRERLDGIYVVTAHATTPDGRCDESIGAVPVESLKGEALSNALMKAETKAKRRVTLAICGLSMLDESEVASVQQSQPTQAKPRRTLDDVAAPQEPAHVESEHVDAHGEVVDEHGIAIPPYSIPTFQSGPDKGKDYSQVPAGKLRALLANKGFLEKASTPQKAWAQYFVDRHEAEKATAQDDADEVAAESEGAA